MNRKAIAALVAVATFFTACGGSSDTAPQAVTVDFKAMVGDQVFSCADSAGYALGTGTLPYIPKDFRFYVSNLRMVAADGTQAPVTLDDSTWQGYGVALLDFENGSGNCTIGTTETNTAVRGTVTPGTYVGLAFDVGVPTAANHLNVQAGQPAARQLGDVLELDHRLQVHQGRRAGAAPRRRPPRIHLQLPPGLDRLHPGAPRATSPPPPAPS